MKQCSKNENHLYPNHLSYCPWCKIAKETGKDSFPSKVGQQIALKAPSIQKGPQLSHSPSSTGNPILEINKKNFEFLNIRAGSSASGSFTINNIGGGTLSGSISTNKRWLRVNQNNIDTSRHRQDISFYVDTSGFNFGSKESGTIEIQSNGGIEKISVSFSIEITEKALSRFKWKVVPALVIIFGSIGGLLPVSLGDILILVSGFIISIYVGLAGGGILGFFFSLFIMAIICEVLSTISPLLTGAVGGAFLSLVIGQYLAKPLFSFQYGHKKTFATYLWLLAVVSLLIFIIGFSSFELDSTNLELDSTNLKTTTNSISMHFVLIPAGEFKMGSPLGEGGRIDNEGPVHTVTIEKAYYLGKYEVTQKQWMEVMGSNPSYFKFWGDDLPVDQVSWNDVQEFIRKLNAKEGTDKYRLPSEAEWEYAARAGTTTQYSFGDSGSKLGEYAWSGLCSHPRPVGQKKPNTWGLYDMHGNVWEWVQDWYHSDYDGAPTDGSAWESGGGSFRVIRGGGWEFFAGGCRSASRADGLRNNYLGFRLVQEV